MDKIIKWLFLITEDGATNLQVIIIGLLICYVLCTVVNSFKQIYYEFKKEME
jgi:hypothetical protein